MDSGAPEPVELAAAPQNAMGSETRHESAEKHVCGEALYTDDIPAPANTLHAYVGLSSTAYGRLKKLDLGKVCKFPGVVAVLTAEDIPGVNDIGPVFPGDPVLVDDKIEFWGQVLFAVAASSHSAARKAARLAVSSYEILPPLNSIEDGLASSAFVRPSHSLSRGDAKGAIAAAPQSLSGDLQIGGQEHMYLEGQACLCIPQEGRGVLVYSSTQHPTGVQQAVASVLGIPMSDVIVDTRRMGGGFGGKETQANQWACIAALLVRKTGRAVKLRLVRSDDFIATGKRHPFLSRYHVGFDDEGRILGLEMTLSAGCGMSPDLSDPVVDRAMFHTDNAYFVPHISVTGHRVKTHRASNTAFRGFGGPQGMVAIENVIDDIARAVGRDPLKVRKLNFYSGEGGRDITPYGQRVEHHVIGPLVERLEINSDYCQRRNDIIKFNQAHEILRKGIALTPVKFGISFMQKHLNQAGALLHIYLDGSIQLNHGGTEMGQGLYTKVAQVVAHELQVDSRRIVCTSTRTDKVPNTSATAASSSSDLNGMAARDAARKVKAKLTAFAAQHFMEKETAVAFVNDSVVVGKNRLGFSELVELAYFNRVQLSATGFYRTPKIHYDRERASGRPFFYYAYGAAVSEVLIDTLTGEYRVTRADICHDVGQSLNPAIDIGQIEGGYIQGMGWLTSEELIWDEDGRLQSLGPNNYKIPTMEDTPIDFNVELLPNSPNVEATIFHSKAVGEPPFMLGISAWSALRDAISSIADYRFSPALDTPATPERVLRACRDIRIRQSCES